MIQELPFSAFHQAAEKVCFDTAAINPLRARCDTSPAGSAVMAIIVRTS